MTTPHPRIALVQLDASPDPTANVRRALDQTRSAARAGASVVCLPELFSAQYFAQREDHDLFDLAEPIPGPTSEAFAAVAREERVGIVLPLFERRTAGLYYNSAAILGPEGQLAGVYRKMHIPDDPLYYEKFYFAPGDLGFLNFNIGNVPLGVLICWDQWYPEAARITALLGAELLVYPTAIGWHPGEKAEWGASQLDAWRTAQRAHAIANGVYVASVNRVGHEQGDVRGDRADGDGIDFWGHSFVADPFGRILAEASGDRPEILYVDLDLHQVEVARRHWPFLRDRRVDAYGPISHRFVGRP